MVRPICVTEGIQLRHDGSYTVIAVRTVLGEVGEQDRVLIIIPFAVRKLTRTLVFVRDASPAPDGLSVHHPISSQFVDVSGAMPVQLIRHTL